MDLKLNKIILWTYPDASTVWTACNLDMDAQALQDHAEALLTAGVVPAGASYQIVDALPAREIDKLEKAARNAKRKAKLAEADAKSVRGLREFVLSKFPADPAVPAALKTAEADAVAERAGLEA